MAPIEGTNRLPSSAAAWLAAFVAAVVFGVICLAIRYWIQISQRLPDFLQPSLEGVAGHVLVALHTFLLISAGVLAALVLLMVSSAIPIRLRQRQRSGERGLLDSKRLLTAAVLLVLACAPARGRQSDRALVWRGHHSG